MMSSMTASLIAPMASSLINAITEKWQEGEFLQLLDLPFIMKVLEKGVRRSGKRYMDKTI